MSYNTQLSAEIVLDTRSFSKKQDGHPIKIRVQHKKRKYIPLNKFCKKEHWNNWVLPSHPNYRKLNNYLKKRNRQLMEEVDFCNENNLNVEESLKVIKNGLSENTDLKIFILQKQIDELRNENSIGLLEFFDITIKEYKALNKSYSHLQQTKKQIIEYTIGEDIPLNDLKRSWINGFSSYKLKNGCGTQGLRYYLSTISSLYNEASRREELNINKPNPIKGMLPQKTRQKEVVIPDPDTFKNILSEVLSDGSTYTALVRQKRVSVFLFQFLIGGHDLADISKLKWNNINKGRIRFKRYKNRNKPNGGAEADNLLIEQALCIIDEYGTKDEERVFSFIPEIAIGNKEYNQYRRKMNVMLSKIAKQHNTKMSTKTPRFMFRSYGGDIGANSMYLQQIMAHKPKGETFTYQRRVSYENVDKVLLDITGLIY